MYMAVHALRKGRNKRRLGRLNEGQRATGSTYRSVKGSSGPQLLWVSVPTSVHRLQGHQKGARSEGEHGAGYWSLVDSQCLC